MFKTTLLAAVAALTVSGAALAQNNANQGGLVNVAVGDIGIDALNNTTVQVPIGIAAQVCGVQANVIAQDNSSIADCTVTQETANEAFINFVSKKK